MSEQQRFANRSLRRNKNQNTEVASKSEKTGSHKCLSHSPFSSVCCSLKRAQEGEKEREETEREKRERGERRDRE